MKEYTNHENNNGDSCGVGESGKYYLQKLILTIKQK